MVGECNCGCRCCRWTENAGWYKNWGCFLSWSCFWHRWVAWRNWRRHQSDERLHRSEGFSGSGWLSEKELQRAVCDHRLWQPHQEWCVCKSGRRRFCGEWCQGQHLACSDAGADGIFCDPLPAYFCGCHGHRFSQPQQIQWLQGLRRRWLPDHDRGSHRNSGWDWKIGHLCRRKAQRFWDWSCKWQYQVYPGWSLYRFCKWS